LSVLVSIVVPTHNYARYLGEAIASVQQQTFTDWECVIVDDGSTDDPSEVMRHVADSRIRFIRQEQAGPSAARNRGLAESTGDLVQFLDADDLLGPMKLQAQVRILRERPDVDLTYCGARYFQDTAAEPDGPEPARVWLDHPPYQVVSGCGLEVLPALLHENIAAIEGPLIRRSLVDRAGGFDPNLRRMEDWEYWLRCAVAGARFLYDPNDDPARLCHVRVHGTSASRDRISMLKSSIRVRQKIHDQLPTPELQRLNQRRVNEQSAELGIREGLAAGSANGVRRLLRSGIAERQPKWLAWALLLPLFRTRIGGWVLSRWRSRKPSLPF
jgi:glycosyltransferase involved in cell wall biosynthesis